MAGVHLDIDLYFWLIERAKLPDDQRNTMDSDAQFVRLYKDNGYRIENAYYFGKLMMQMRLAIIK